MTAEQRKDDQLTPEDVRRLYSYPVVGGILRLAVGTIQFFRFLADDAFAISVVMNGEATSDKRVETLPKK